MHFYVLKEIGGKWSSCSSCDASVMICIAKKTLTEMMVVEGQDAIVAETK
jgi:hypothetical protein